MIEGVLETEGFNGRGQKVGYVTAKVKICFVDENGDEFGLCQECQGKLAGIDVEEYERKEH